MSYRFAANAGLYIDKAYATAVPLWFVAGFASVIPAGLTQLLLVQGTAASNNNRFSLGLGDGTNPVVAAGSRTTATAQANASAGVVNTNWHVGLAELISATSRRIQYDSGNVGTNATNNTPVAGGINRFCVGVNPILNNFGFTGDIAYAAIGTGSLNAGDRTLLGAGGDPRLVTGGVLAELWDFTSPTPLVGLVLGDTLTLGPTPPTLVGDAPAYPWLWINMNEDGAGVVGNVVKSGRLSTNVVGNVVR